MKDLNARLVALSPMQRERLQQEMEKKGIKPGLRLPDSGTPAAPSRGSGGVEHGPATEAPRARRAGKGMNFSLFFFSDDGTKQTGSKYRLLLESAQFADQHGFCAVWTPERHFQDFGGLYPNPSVLSAALAMVTRRTQLRAGSVALPLHNPIRVAEDWSVVDNLSEGRVGVAFASGWHPLDFVLAPQSYRQRKDLLFEYINTIQRLWAGEALTVEGVDGNVAEVRVLPRPIQPRLPVWISIASSRESWRRAGEIGANVLTAIVKQPPDVLAQKIALYREARARHGHDPEAGQVAVMLHAFLGEDEGRVKELVREPLTHYFRSNLKQLETHTDLRAKSGAGAAQLELDSLSEKDLNDIGAYAFERYYDTSLLCGTPDKCTRLVDTLIEVGVNEVACLIDFGLSFETVMEGLPHLNVLRERYAPESCAAARCA
ncbi:MAG: LLM class flavin-dependent oxidoreductase [Acidobacteriota bacterium]|nr:LLM class flavin-dependent oxidoreductase [Acidobacteriota bacterium]